MYYLEDTCFLCLKNNLELHNVFIEDNDGIDFNEKLRCGFPEIFNSTPDAHKLACLECFAKLRLLYKSKQSVISSSTVMRNYCDKLQCENKTFQQPSVILSARKRRKKDSNMRNLPEVKVENVENSFKLKIKNHSHNSTNDKQLNKIAHSFQSTANENVALLTKYNCLTEEKELETKNVEKVVPFTETGAICAKQEPQFSNLNFSSTNEEQLNTIDHSSQPAANENVAFLTEYNCLTNERNLETKNVEKVVSIIETGTIYIKPEPQTIEDDSTTDYLDKELKDSEGSTSSNEDDPDFEIAEKLTSRSNDYNNQNINTIPLKPPYISDESVKFCKTCQNLLFEDLNNIKVHLYNHIRSSNCSRCQDSLEEIHKFQRHMFNHCETMVEMLDKVEHGEKFSCALCDQQFDEFNNLKKHIPDEHITSLQCVVCSEAFPYKSHLFRHILVTHCQVKLFKCKICPTRFVCKEGIKDHMIYLHYSGKVCICKYCGQTFRNPGTLREHISKIHKDVQRVQEEKLPIYDSLKNSDAVEKFPCPICNKLFDNVDNLRKHLFANHLNSLECEICSKTYTHRRLLNRHIMQQHCRLKIINCKLCPHRFATRKGYKVHMDQQHSSDKVGAITRLDNEVGAFTEQDNNVGAVTELENSADPIAKPEEIFIKEDPYYSEEYCSSEEEYEADNYEKEKDFSNFAMAEETNNRTSNSYNLQEDIGSSVIHTATATTEASYCEPRAPVDQSDVCDICQKMFLFLSNLSEHLNTHMQESSCFMCKDSAENISRLQRHMLTPCGNTNKPQHTANTAKTQINEKPTCVVCGQSFKFNSLKKHMYDHITDLTCVVCGRSFSQKCHLLRHLITHCNLKPYQCKICDRKYTLKESLKYHMDAKHTSNVAVCQYCQKIMKCPKTLRAHIKNRHPHVTHRCEVCERIFLDKNELEKHAKLHTFLQ